MRKQSNIIEKIKILTIAFHHSSLKATLVPEK